MKLTNDEIARVFAMYIGLSECTDSRYNNRGLLETVTRTGNIALEVGNTYSHTNISNCKLLLTTLDKISDEHAIEIKNLLDVSNAVWEIDEYTTKDIANWLLGKRLYMYSHCFQLLVLNGYAVPLFFGLNHWANGKTAIELGIAIDKTIQPTN